VSTLPIPPIITKDSVTVETPIARNRSQDLLVLKPSSATSSTSLDEPKHTTSPYHLVVTFASDRALLKSSDPTNISSPIQLDQICHLSSIIETGEEIKYQARIDFDWILYFDNLVNGVKQSLDSNDEKIQKTSTNKLTRRKIMQRPDAHRWEEAKFKQLDTHERDKMYGKPCPRPKYGIVLRSVWTYADKGEGHDPKARQCMDGRPLRDNKWRRIESIYTACISQVGTKIFFATCALENYIIYDLDAVNAFGQAGSLFHIVYIDIDIQYLCRSHEQFWEEVSLFRECFTCIKHASQIINKEIDRKVIVARTMSGGWWETRS